MADIHDNCPQWLVNVMKTVTGLKGWAVEHTDHVCEWWEPQTCRHGQPLWLHPTDEQFDEWGHDIGPMPEPGCPLYLAKRRPA